MKKEVFIFALLFLLIMPLISAVELNIKPEYKQGETLIAKISGNFLEPIIKDNIYFYRGHTLIPMEYDVARIGEDYYIYAILVGKNPNNYSIKIKDTSYYVLGGQTSDDDIVLNFTITEDFADFSIKPGFFITEGDFSIEVQNLQDSSITIKIETNQEEQPEQGFFAKLFGTTTQEEQTTITLNAGKIEQINFNSENLTNATINKINLSTTNLEYEIPVYIILKEETSEGEKKDFEFELNDINVSMATNSTTERIIYLKNIGGETIDNITLELTGGLEEYIFISDFVIDDIKFNKSAKITLEISSGEDEGIVSGRLEARTIDPLFDSMNITLNFLKDYIPFNETIEDGTSEDEKPAISKTCEELDGIICEDGFKCSKQTTKAKDGYCCLDECKVKSNSSTGRIIGWTIVIILVIAFIWFYLTRYRRPRRISKVDLLRISRGRR